MADLYEGQSSSSEDEGSDEPQSFLFENNRVYLANDLVVFDRPFFVGCIGKIRSIPTKKKIPENLFWYATYSDKTEKWKESTKENKKAKLLIHQDWVRSNLPKFTGDQTKYKYKPLPPLVILSEEEKFRDGDGNTCEVEVRGTRSKDGVRFKLKDIQRIFEIPDLCSNISHIIDKEEYEIFCSLMLVQSTSISKQNTCGQQTVVFISYKGLLKVIFSARSGTADSFQDWATGVLFTAHLGTEEQKDELALELTGVDHKMYKDALRPLVVPLPGIYLHQIGKVKVMKELNPNLRHLDTSVGTDHSIQKFGRSIDYRSRGADHSRNYPKKFKGTSCGTTYFTPVNEKLLSKAETDLSHFFKDKNKMIELEGENELVMLTREDMADVNAKYKELNKMYGFVGDVKVVMGENNVLTNQVEQLTTQLQQSNIRDT